MALVGLNQKTILALTFLKKVAIGLTKQNKNCLIKEVEALLLTLVTTHNKVHYTLVSVSSGHLGNTLLSNGVRSLANSLWQPAYAIIAPLSVQYSKLG